MPRDIKFLVLHCAATPNGRWTTTLDINAWHHDRGFRRSAETRVGLNPKLDAIGYHFVIYTNGAVATGRGPNEVGAHVAGHNTGSLGICLVGTDRFYAEQWDSLRRLVWQLCDQYRIPASPADPKDPRGLRGVIGHGEIPGVAKACPGFPVREWLLTGMNPKPEHLLHG